MYQIYFTNTFLLILHLLNQPHKPQSIMSKNKDNVVLKNMQIIILLLNLLILGCKESKESETIILDLETNPSKVELFAEGIISTGLYERDIAIAPNGNELIYTLGDYKQQKRCLVQINRIEGKWSQPKIVTLSGKYQDIEPFYTEDGQRLFFASNRPIEKDSTRNDYNIWYSDRDGDKWSDPKALNDKINTEEDEFYPSLSKNGNLYFTATRKEGIGREDIFVSKKVNGEYQEAVVLDSTINTAYFEFNSYINLEENLLIFSSFGREDGLGGGDLYYSIKDKEGNWSESKNMGENINSPQLDYCPFIDIERNNLYFTSEKFDLNTSRIKTVEDLKLYSNQTKNGMGNIYRIGLEELKLN